jgi:hypothetical protein
MPSVLRAAPFIHGSGIALESNDIGQIQPKLLQDHSRYQPCQPSSIHVLRNGHKANEPLLKRKVC